MTHVLGIVPHILMVANEELTHAIRVLLDLLQTFVAVPQVQRLQLKGSDRIGIELLELCARGPHSLRLSIDFAHLVELINRGGGLLVVAATLGLVLLKNERLDLFDCLFLD